MKILRAVTEAEVIGEFLRNEFYEPDYNHDRDLHEALVLHPDYTSAYENAVRRALLYRRRGPMWRELPKDTSWLHVRLEPADMGLVHVFPRAQWRKISNGSYHIDEVVRQIRERNYRDGGGHVIAKIQQLRYRIQAGHQDRSTVVLIGIDEKSPMTIFEGNHRLSAAMLVGPHAVSSFEVVCGFSPRMIECCFYRTNFPNLWRYVKNRLANLVYDAEADVGRVTRAMAQSSITIQPASVGTPLPAKLTEHQS
jgi:hypothetical protein